MRHGRLPLRWPVSSTFGRIRCGPQAVGASTICPVPRARGRRARAVTDGDGDGPCRTLAAVPCPSCGARRARGRPLLPDLRPRAAGAAAGRAACRHGPVRRPRRVHDPVGVPRPRAGRRTSSTAASSGSWPTSTAFGGRVDKIIGDAIVALFGAPVAHEDDAERAVRAALRMQQTLARHAGRLSAPGADAHRRQHRRGAGRRRCGPAATTPPWATSVNTAQRLQTAAPPGRCPGRARHPRRHAQSVIALRADGRPAGAEAGTSRSTPGWPLEPLAPPGLRPVAVRAPLVGRDRRAPAAARRHRSSPSRTTRAFLARRGRGRRGQEPPRRGADRRGQGGLRRASCSWAAACPTARPTCGGRSPTLRARAAASRRRPARRGAGAGAARRSCGARASAPRPPRCSGSPRVCCTCSATDTASTHRPRPSPQRGGPARCWRSSTASSAQAPLVVAVADLHWADPLRARPARPHRSPSSAACRSPSSPRPRPGVEQLAAAAAAATTRVLLRLDPLDRRPPASWSAPARRRRRRRRAKTSCSTAAAATRCSSRSWPRWCRRRRRGRRAARHAAGPGGGPARRAVDSTSATCSRTPPSSARRAPGRASSSSAGTSTRPRRATRWPRWPTPRAPRRRRRRVGVPVRVGPRGCVPDADQGRPGPAPRRRRRQHGALQGGRPGRRHRAPLRRRRRAHARARAGAGRGLRHHRPRGGVAHPLGRARPRPARVPGCGAAHGARAGPARPGRGRPRRRAAASACCCCAAMPVPMSTTSSRLGRRLRGPGGGDADR